MLIGIVVLSSGWDAYHNRRSSGLHTGIARCYAGGILLTLGITTVCACGLAITNKVRDCGAVLRLLPTRRYVFKTIAFVIALVSTWIFPFVPNMGNVAIIMWLVFGALFVTSVFTREQDEVKT